MNKICLATLLFAITCQAQRAQPINGVRVWTGTVKYTAQGNGTHRYPEGGLIGEENWLIDSSANMRIRAEWNEGLRYYTGKILSGHVKVFQRLTRTGGSPVLTFTSRWTGEADLGSAPDGDARSYDVNVYRDGTIRLVNLDQSIPVFFDRPGNPWTTTAPWQQIEAGAEEPRIAVPPNTTRLQGSYLVKANAFFMLTSNLNPPHNWKVEYDLQAETEELEVIVTSAGYRNWRPQAGPGGTRAATQLGLTATLQKVGGGEPATARARTFEWKFPAMSREPGYAMNVPVQNPQRTPDMRFEPSGTLTVTGADGQSAEAVPGRLLVSEASVGSYDYGGYGTVEVVAVLEDGRRIQGKMEGESAIRLPRRAAGDPIAAKWREDNGVGDRPAAADDDNLPVGDGNKGDGLTLYEEYRGFLEDGLHQEGDPRRKDLFVYNQAKTHVAGILLFRRLSQLAVHFNLAEDEAAPDRVINRNHGAAPHVVEQHLVEVVAGAANLGKSTTIGGPGNPGMIERIVVAGVSGTDSPEHAAAKIRTLTHELFHAVNVWHHGDDKDAKVRWVQRDGVIYETELDARGNPRRGERKVTVLTEDGMPVPLENIPPQGITMYVGIEGGEHSGEEDCVMRYRVANASVSSRDYGTRYWVAEKEGRSLCRQREGTGVNHRNYKPEPRYGDAAPGRGDCAHQILVNDAVIAPRR